jgi:hypothetical protein
MVAWNKVVTGGLGGGEPERIPKMFMYFFLLKE